MKIDIVGDYRIELQTGPIKNPGYRVYKASWQTHKDHRPVKNQRPRWKLIATFHTEAEARAEIDKRKGVTKE